MSQLIDPTFVVDCACVIHGTTYDWSYVEKLHSMLTRNFSYPIRLHVFTEIERDVPPHMVKHVLKPWQNISGPRRAWWYKMQMFNPKHFAGRLLYFDLDVLIIRNLDWMLAMPSEHFCTIRDFRHLWKPNWRTINSSIMLWNTHRFKHIWEGFNKQPINELVQKYPGDQDYVTAMIDLAAIRFFSTESVQSWRWQVLDGGMDMKTKLHRSPGKGATITPDLSVVVFHGRPKPQDIKDPFVINNWR